MNDDDKNKNPDIEDLEDDIDIDEDFDDLDWDDFDEEDEDDSDEKQEPQPKNETPKASPAKSGERTFVQKYFNVIVIAVVMVLGAGWLLLNSGGGNNTAQSSIANEEPVENEIAQPSQPASQPPAAPTAGILSGQSTLDRFEQAAKRGDPPMPVPMAPTEEEVLTPVPGEATQEAEVMESVEEPLFSESAEVRDSALPDPVEAQPISQDTGDNAKITALAGQLDKAKADIKQSEQEFMKALDQKNDVISQLYDNISDLESEVDALRAQLKQQQETHKKELSQARETAKKQPQTKVAAAPKPQPKTQPTTSKKVKQKKPEPKTTPTKAFAPKNWVLRSAQPGKAIVSPENSQDLKTVSVGDQLSGIGQIRSIGIENGKWVIVGSSGRISQ